MVVERKDKEEDNQREMGNLLFSSVLNLYGSWKKDGDEKTLKTRKNQMRLMYEDEWAPKS